MSPRRSDSSSAASASTCWPARRRSSSSPTRRPIRSTSPAILISLSRPLAEAVLEHVDRYLADSWPTAEVASVSWRDHGSIVVVDSREEAAALANWYAAEHVEVQVDDAELDFYLEALR